MLTQVTTLRIKHNPPVVRCRRCGQFTDVQYQPPVITPRMAALGIRKPARWQVTCRYPSCPIHNETFDAATYHTVDLDTYLKDSAG